MPYLRPDRKGLPDPPASDEEDGSIPRSESYLRLHGLDNPTNASSQMSDTSPHDPNAEMETRSRRTSMSKPAEMTPLVEFSSASAQSPSDSRPTTSSKPDESALGGSIATSGKGRNGMMFSDVLVESPPAKTDSLAEKSPRSSIVMSPPISKPSSPTGKEKGVMFAEVSKRLKEDKKEKKKAAEKSPKKDDSPPILEMKRSSKSPPSSPTVEKTSPQSPPPDSPKSLPRSPPTSTKSPPRSPTRSPSRFPRLFRRSSKDKKAAEVPVEVAPSPSPPPRRVPNSDGDVDSPAPPSDNTSNISSRQQIEPVPVRMSPPPSPIVARSPPVEVVKVEKKPSIKRKTSTTKSVTQIPTKKVEKKEVPIASPKKDSKPEQSIQSAPIATAPANTQRQPRPMSSGAPVLPRIPTTSKLTIPTIKPMTPLSVPEPSKSRPISPIAESSQLPDLRRASKQFITPAEALKRTSGQSAAAHMATRQGDVLQTVCYGPVQFADIAEAYNDSALGRTVLDYPLLKRLDEAIFHRHEEREVVNNSTVRSYIITAETRLLLVVQQFMITAALLPAHKKVFEEAEFVEPDPLIKFVDDAEALIQYMVDDLEQQPDIFSPSKMNFMGFIIERHQLAKISKEPSFYFRHEISETTLKYVQGLCETICGLWPNGKFFIEADTVNARDSFTPASFHTRKSTDNNIVTSEFNRYFYDPGVLGHIVASEYRQLLRGAFPFLASLGRQPKERSDRERDMPVDAAFVERGVFKFERTMFVREHLMVDHERKVRIYVDEFDGTRYLVYFNHRIGRSLGLSHLGFEILQTYNLLFSTPRSQKIARRLTINYPSLSTFDTLFTHQHIFTSTPRVDEFILFKDRICMLQHRLATFRPEKWKDVFTGGYAQPIWRGVVWFMVTVVVLVLASIVATVLVNALVR